MKKKEKEREEKREKNQKSKRQIDLMLIQCGLSNSGMS